MRTQRSPHPGAQCILALEKAAGIYGLCARLLVVALPQLGDFDSLEYAWWLQHAAERLREARITIRAVGIGDRASGEQFCKNGDQLGHWFTLNGWKREIRKLPTPTIAASIHLQQIV